MELSCSALLIRFSCVWFAYPFES